jgi:hypothetical protein
MGAKSERKRKRAQSRKKRLSQGAALVVATVGVAAGSFLPAANTVGHATATVDPARCVVLQVSRW